MKKFRLILLLILLLPMSCGINNTMYNARKYFRMAQARPLNANGRPSPQAVDEYTKSIKKCGIILSKKHKSGKTDDALYLMAQALYLKGNSAFQAKDQFEALIKGFPDSKYFGEAHIYLARVLRDVNLPQEAQKLLEDFLRDPGHEKLHPRAILTLVDFAITDKDYERAQVWLEKIIEDYPKAREFGDAYLLFGKNYYIQKDYASSLAEFEKITSQRRISKDLKLTARYYIALNQYELSQYEASQKMIQRLLRDEYRPESLAQAKVLQTRLLFATGAGEKGVELSADISKLYPRTKSSAEALYYLGDYSFYQLKDLEKAGTAYSRVKSEFNGSELADLSQRKSTAVNQLKQNTNLNPQTNIQQFLDYHMAAAENYLSPFELPDSALVMYQRLKDSRQQVLALRDSLALLIPQLKLQKDSLAAVLDSLPEPVAEVTIPDTSSVAAISDTLVVADSLAAPPALVETELTAAADSLNLADLAALSDTLAVADSLAGTVAEAAPPVLTAAQLEQQITALQADIRAKEAILKDLEPLLLRYEVEIVPLALFSQAVVYNKRPESADRIQEIYTQMQAEYPANKYTNALSAMISGAPIRLVDPAEERDEQSLDHALDLFETQPDSMVVLLDELLASDYTPIRLKANFRLGWHYAFERADTTRAKPYLEEVLSLEKSGDYAAMTRRFFNGTNFIQRQEIPDSLEAKASADSLRNKDEEAKPPSEEAKPPAEEIQTLIPAPPETPVGKEELPPQPEPELLPEIVPEPEPKPSLPPPEDLPE